MNTFTKQYNVEVKDSQRATLSRVFKSQVQMALYAGGSANLTVDNGEVYNCSLIATLDITGETAHRIIIGIGNRGGVKFRSEWLNGFQTQ